MPQPLLPAALHAGSTWLHPRESSHPQALLRSFFKGSYSLCGCGFCVFLEVVSSESHVAILHWYLPGTFHSGMVISGFESSRLWVVKILSVCPCVSRSFSSAF